MREVVLDTETTGLSPDAGHRIVEIGCVELQNGLPTGENYHAYVNPERDMPAEAYRIHQLSEVFLSQHQTFAEIVEAFVAFLGDAPLVIHNAAFDMRFLNAELKRLGRAKIESKRAVDTLAIARQKFPGANASLDALCRRFNVDLSVRTSHGALVDAELLSEVYAHLTGRHQPMLTLDVVKRTATRQTAAKTVRPARSHAPTAAELANHDGFIKGLKKPIWQR